MQRIVGVKFSGGKVYSFDPGRYEPEIGDEVIVETSLGQSLGTVATPIREIDETPDDLKSIIRLASADDKNRWSDLKKRAQKDLPLIKEKVKKLDLAMKIVSAEYTFDASKIVIEFSADDRVDFRELLKELASALRVRIELHQVGQRDEVKIKGGIGPCGEICCCVRFLKDFEHVTVKMAKNQGLSLSPTKISGLCGRLMCCLGYENKMYEDILKKMPKVNSEISTPKGKGNVVFNDVLRERVSVKIRGNDDSFTIYDFSLDELSQKPNESQESKQENSQANAPVEAESAGGEPAESEKPAKSEKSEQPQKQNHRNNRRPRNKFKSKKENKNGVPNNR